MKMRKSVLAATTLFSTLTIVLALRPPTASMSGTTGVGTFSSVKKANDENVSVTYKDGQGTTKTISVSTGEQGTDGEADDLPKGMTGVDKAQRIAEAINEAGAQDGVVATANGGVVTVTAPGGVSAFTVTNNTREKENSTKIHNPNAATAQQQSAEASATFVGSLAGADDDGHGAQVSLGTNRFVVTVQTSNFRSVSDMCRSIVRQLVANGVSASLVTSTVIRIVIDPALDEQVHYGNTDVALIQEVTFEVK